MCRKQPGHISIAGFMHNLHFTYQLQVNYRKFLGKVHVLTIVLQEGDRRVSIHRDRAKHAQSLTVYTQPVWNDAQKKFTNFLFMLFLVMVAMMEVVIMMVVQQYDGSNILHLSLARYWFNKVSRLFFFLKKEFRGLEGGQPGTFPLENNNQ